jgi:hypothetical protein
MSRTPTRYPLTVDAAGPGKTVRTRARSAPSGESISYLGRTLLPLPGTLQQQGTYTVQAGDRIDNVAARLLGDPLLYWMLMEANGASDPATLCAAPGSKIVVPAAVGQQTSSLDHPRAAARTAAPAPASHRDDVDEMP